jgi:hypothetical protein
MWVECILNWGIVCLAKIIIEGVCQHAVSGNFKKYIERAILKSSSWNVGWLADSTPQSANNQTPNCWNGRFGIFIDRLVFGKRANQSVVTDFFQELIYEEQREDDFKFSDHYPILLKIKF